jgi:hypothetical protein
MGGPYLWQASEGAGFEEAFGQYSILTQDWALYRKGPAGIAEIARTGAGATMQLMIMKGATDAVASPSPCGLAIPYTQQASRRRRRLQDVVKLRFERYDYNGLPTALKLSVNNIYGKRADSVTYKRDDRHSDAEAIMRDPVSWPIREAEMGADVGPTEKPSVAAGADVGPTEKPSVAAGVLTATPTNRTSNETLRTPPTVSLASATMVGGAPSAFLHPALPHHALCPAPRFVSFAGSPFRHCNCRVGSP